MVIAKGRAGRVMLPGQVPTSAAPWKQQSSGEGSVGRWTAVLGDSLSSFVRDILRTLR